jgi:hypothetical protein
LQFLQGGRLAARLNARPLSLRPTSPIAGYSPASIAVIKYPPRVEHGKGTGTLFGRNKSLVTNIRREGTIVNAAREFAGIPLIRSNVCANLSSRVEQTFTREEP